MTTDVTPEGLDQRDDPPPDNTPTTTDAEQSEQPKQPSAATTLVNIALERYDLGVSDSGETYGVPKQGPMVVQLLRGGKTSLRGELSREYFRSMGRAVGQQALSDALTTLDGFAQELEPTRLWQRVAQAGGALWLDLGDPTGSAVRLVPGGWSVVDRPPVLFRRTPLTGPLPVPEPGGDLKELWQWLNVAEDDRPPVLAWLISALWPDLPHPILGLFGEQGTGKTTAMKVLVSLLDAGPVPYRKPPRDPDSWVTAAAGSWLVGLDNLSTVPDWLSDSLCRAVTGDGDVRRKLYTDGELSTFAFRRAIAVTGIDLGALNGDLAERLLSVVLEPIAEQNRQDEEELWPRWAEVHPRLLGALLDLAVAVLAILDTVRLERRPRMADYARRLRAVDLVLGTEGLARYAGAQTRMAEEALTGDPFIGAVQQTLDKGTFTGTSGELLARVPVPEGRVPKGWPTTARAVTALLHRQAPVMRKAHWVVREQENRHTKVTTWTITPPAQEIGRESPPQDPQDPQDAGYAGYAGHDPDLSPTGGTAGHGVWLASGDPYHPDCTRCETHRVTVPEGTTP